MALSNIKAKLKQYQEALKIVSKEKQAESKFLKVVTEKYFLQNGNTLTRDYLLKGSNDGSAAIVIALTEDNQILFVMQPRVLKQMSASLELPAGYIEENETAIEAGIRELREETGYEPEKVELLTSFYQDSGISSAYNSVIIGYNCKRVGEQQLDLEEYIQIIKMDIDEAYELLECGVMNDANTMIGLYAYQKKKEMRKK
ncbi:MAG: NUDIX hydrolase [Firmicutes bacterium]|nr:NUDIX hydrolase [Bacillota bacterium]